MVEQITGAVKTLERFLETGGGVDRAEVVAHATLSAFAHHWPSRTPVEIHSLLEATQVIREREGSRWLVQRRLAVARLAPLLA